MWGSPAAGSMIQSSSSPSTPSATSSVNRYTGRKLAVTSICSSSSWLSAADSSSVGPSRASSPQPVSNEPTSDSAISRVFNRLGIAYPPVTWRLVFQNRPLSLFGFPDCTPAAPPALAHFLQQSGERFGRKRRRLRKKCANASVDRRSGVDPAKVKPKRLSDRLRCKRNRGRRRAG